MSARFPRSIATALTLGLLALLAGKSRADDFEDRLLKKVQQRRGAETAELKRDVADALMRAQSLATSEPEKALGLLRTTLARLRDDHLLSPGEQKALTRAVEERLRPVQECVAAKARAMATTARPHKGGQAGVASSPQTPAGGVGPYSVRVGLATTFTGPLGTPTGALNTTVRVPDGGTALVGGYSRLSEGRHEFGPPGLSNVPYGSRLFKNTAAGRSVGVFRVYVGVRVISLHEEDERLLSQAPAR